LRLKNWLTGWGAAGLAAPALYLIVHLVASYDLFIFPLWPASILGMALEPNPPLVTVILFWLVAIAANVLLYGLIGLLLWPVARLKSKTPWDDENK
jgi:hypothetical protein